MTTLDPFIIQWPRKWIEDPEIGPVIHYLNRFLHDLFILSDGGDLIEDENADNDSLGARLAGIIKKIEEIEMQPVRMARIAALEKRISDLELQQ